MARALEADVRDGLAQVPKTLPPKWFYDDRGSELFDAITRLPEYYPTRAERAILQERAGEIASRTGADTLVELGSGTSEKTRLLLDALAHAGTLQRFVPFDVSEETLRAAAAAVAAEYGDVEVHAVVGDFEHHLRRIPGGGRRVVAFLGSTIGNLAPDARADVPRRGGRRARPGRLAAPRHRPREGRRTPRRGVRRRRRRDRRVQPQRPAGARPRARRRLRRRRVRTRRPLERAGGVDRDVAPVRRARSGWSSRASVCTSSSAKARSSAPRSAPSSGVAALNASSPLQGSGSTRGGPTPRATSPCRSRPRADADPATSVGRRGSGMTVRPGGSSNTSKRSPSARSETRPPISGTPSSTRRPIQLGSSGAMCRHSLRTSGSKWSIERRNSSGDAAAHAWGEHEVG